MIEGESNQGVGREILILQTLEWDKLAIETGVNMHALDVLPQLPQMTANLAEHWIAATLAEARALHQYDHRLLPTVDDPELMRESRALREAWRLWSLDAKSLLEGIDLTWNVPGRLELEKTLLTAAAFAQCRAEEMLRRYNAIQAGERMHTPEEVRRELGLPPRR